MANLDFAVALGNPLKKFSATFSLDLDDLAQAFKPNEVAGGASGKLVFYVDGEGVLSLEGYAKVPFKFVCDRCNGAFQRDLFVNIAERVYPAGANAEDAELFYSRPQLDLDSLIRNVVVASFPSKVLCREDCKGLCPKCGCNLNDGECNCDR